MNKQIITLILLSITLTSLVSADILLSLLTPQVLFEGKVGDVKDYYVGVSNRNTFPINISITGPSTVDIVFQGDTFFELQPNQSRNVNYTVTLTRIGNYSEGISVGYSGNGSSFSLTSNLIFIVSGDDNNQQEDNNDGGSSGSSSSPSGSSGGGLLIMPNVSNKTIPISDSNISPLNESIPLLPTDPMFIVKEGFWKKNISWISMVSLLLVACVVAILISRKIKEKSTSQVK